MQGCLIKFLMTQRELSASRPVLEQILRLNSVTRAVHNHVPGEPFTYTFTITRRR